MARWVKSHNQMRIFKQTATPAVVDGLKVGDIWIDINSGAILKVCTAISPVTFASDSLDGSGNFAANNVIQGYTSTATAAATTTLTVASTQVQVFTGITTQTVVLPVVSTLTVGTSYVIINLSSGVVTLQSSGANTVQAIQANSSIIVRSNASSGTTASVWHIQEYVPAASGQTGSGSLVRATSPILVTPALGTVASGDISACTSTSMALVTPVLGTPTSGVLTNCTGTASGLTAGTVTTNANLTGDVTSSGNATTLSTPGSITVATDDKVLVKDTSASDVYKYVTVQSIRDIAPGSATITSAQLATALTDETGSGTAVFNTSPSLVTPTLGVASATSVNFGQQALGYYGEAQSWTPAFSFTTPGDISVSYATQTGAYYRIGTGLVFATWVLICTPTFSTASGALRITGLPFAAKSALPFSMAGIISNQSAGITYPAGTTSAVPTATTNATTLGVTCIGSATAAAVLSITSFVSGVAITLNGGCIYAMA